MALSQLFKFLNVEDLVKALAKSGELERASAEARRRALRRRFEHPEVLPLPTAKGRAPETPGEGLAPKQLEFGSSKIDLSRKWSGQPIMSTEGQKRLTRMLELISEEGRKGGLTERRYIPMLEQVPGGEPKRINVTLERAAELYEKNPEKYTFATTPTGGPPVKHAHVRPGGGVEYELYNVKSLVPELKREAAKMAQEVKGVEPPVKRPTVIRATTKEDLAWTSIKTIPGETKWWKNISQSVKGGKSGMKFQGSAEQFFKKEYNAFRADPFEYVKKQGRDRMVRKFNVYKDLGLLP